MKKTAKYVWGSFPDGGEQLFLIVTLEEVEDILDGYVLDEINEFIISGQLANHLLEDLTPYLCMRARQYLGLE